MTNILKDLWHKLTTPRATDEDEERREPTANVVAERQSLPVAGRGQARQQAALLRLSAELAATLDETEVCQRVVHGLHDTLGYDNVALTLVDEITGDRVVTALVGLGFPLSRLAPGQGLSERPLLDGQLHYTPDVTKDVRFVPGLGGSEVDVPVRIGGEVLGVLVVESRQRNAFNQDDFEVLTAAAQQTGLAIEKARLLAAERQRADELDALRTTMADITAELELSALLQPIVKRAVELLDATNGELGLYDETSQETEVAFVYGHDVHVVGTRHPLGEGAMGYVAETGEPLIIQDYKTWERRAPQYEDVNLHSIVSAPLKVRGRLVGVIGLSDADPDRRFSHADLRLLNMFAQQAAIAVENARLYDQAQREIAERKRAEAERERLLTAERAQAQRQAALLRLSAELAAALDETEVCQRVVDGLHDTLDYDILGLYLVDETTGDRVVTAFVGSGFPQSRLVPGQGLSERPLLDGQLHYTPDVTQAARYVPGLSGSEVDVPVRIGGEVLGVLVVESRQRNAFNQDDFEVLTATAQQTGLAIEKARLLTTERQRADELDALRTTMAEITAELELSALLQAIVERAAGLLDATMAELGLYDEISQETEVAFAYGHDVHTVGTRHPLGEGAMGYVAETGEPLIIENYKEWDRRAPQYIDVPAHSTVAAPLQVGGRLVGVIVLSDTNLDRQFSPADLRLLNMFAQQAAIAIENARLYDQAQRAAVMEERSRLARELHDSVTQSLYSLTLLSEAGQRLAEAGELERVAGYLTRIGAIGQQALNEMRLLVYELRPLALESEGLIGALRHRLDAVEQRAGVGGRLVIGGAAGTIQLPATLEEELFRIAQEALNNTLKHAAPTSVEVRIHVESSDMNQCVELEVIDNGQGFDLDAVSDKGGMGLVSMRERAEKIGGKLTIRSAPGEGTRVKIVVGGQWPVGGDE
jgi:GAF domain-containing protein/anti-sigma regulatory factor (Ser/Thr protein kinase)